MLLVMMHLPDLASRALLQLLHDQADLEACRGGHLGHGQASQALMAQGVPPSQLLGRAPASLDQQAG